ncbi:MAG: hypothetical protein K9M96_10275 [Deltaproteobacteria bacterium]|nr:hypothetical protein [Deltaproteobacteria bacterium]
MLDLLEKWQIADGVVRITLFRILPGKELEVGRSIETLCEKMGLKQDSFRVFRLFGSYDLVFIQANASLTTSDFVKLGTIPFITASSEYVCYKWEDRKTKSATFGIGEILNPILGLCFVKINPTIVQSSGLGPEVAFVEYLRNKLSKIHMVGSLGWFEVILLLSESSLSSILNIIGEELPRLIYRYETPEQQGSTSFFFAEKTLSLIGHELDVSDPKIKTNRSTVPLPKSNSSGGVLSINFSLSCKPRAMGTIESEAIKHFGLRGEEKHINFRFGPRDLEFAVPLDKIKTLNELIQKLDKFRLSNMDTLIKTYTDIQYNYNEHDWWIDASEHSNDVKGYLILEISEEEARNLVSLGPEGAAVASSIYKYNNLVGNDIVTDAFVDILRFIEVTRKLASTAKNGLTVAQRRQIIRRLRDTKDAIAQRSQGVYVGIEEAPFATSSSGIGIVRILKALDCFVTVILNRLQKKWNGFVLCGDFSRFEHRDDLIVVPTDAALDVQRYWAITHETMHVLQHISPNELSAREIFPSNKGPAVSRYAEVGTSFWYIVHEICAEVLDYSVCCQLDLKEYLTTIWTYLIDRIFEHHDKEQLRSYLFRSFAVICYDQLVSSHGVDRALLNPTSVKSTICGKLDYFRAYDVLRPLFEQDERGEVEFEIIVKEFIADILPALPDLFERIEEIVPVARSGAKKQSKKVLAGYIRRLKGGRILMENELHNPEVLAWLMGRTTIDNLPDKGTIAWILSLWNMYHVQRLGPDLTKLIS